MFSSRLRSWLLVSALLGLGSCELNPQPGLPGHDAGSGPKPSEPTIEAPGSTGGKTSEGSNGGKGGSGVIIEPGSGGSGGLGGVDVPPKGDGGDAAAVGGASDGGAPNEAGGAWNDAPGDGGAAP